MKTELTKLINQVLFQEKPKEFEGKQYWDIHSTMNKDELTETIYEFVKLYKIFNDGVGNELSDEDIDNAIAKLTLARLEKEVKK